LPDKVHVDNGADFRSRAFKRGCDDAGIAIDWRPPGTPRFGGHIERLKRGRKRPRSLFGPPRGAGALPHLGHQSKHARFGVNKKVIDL
ncbi:hypothetical protein ACEWPN_00880, partial [Yoonia sp. R2-816]